MNLTFFIIWIIILAFDGILMAVLTRMAESERFKHL